MDAPNTNRVYRGVLLNLIRQLDRPVLTGAEVGAGAGGTSALLLSTFGGLTLYMVDWWAAYSPRSAYVKTGDRRARLSHSEHEGRYIGAMRDTEFAADRRKVLRMKSADAALQIPHDSLDFVFIDGSHAFDDVRADLRFWWPLVRAGGLFCGHDYSTDNQKFGGVRLAVDNFFAARKMLFNVEPCSIWWVRKP